MSSEQSSRLDLPFLQPAQAQKHVTVNEALLRLDALVQAAAVSRALAAQPATPADGALYLLPTGKTGAVWGGFADGALAYWRDGVWEQLTPKPGWRVFVLDEGLGLVRQDGTWAVEAAAQGPGGALTGFRNRLMNGDFSINQRGFAGGALAAGAFGPDRWRAGPGGATLTLAGGAATLVGSLEQTIEAAGLKAGPVAFSVESPSADLGVALIVGGSTVATATVAAGAGRRVGVLTLAADAPGDVTVRLTASATTTFAQAQLEPGRAAAPFEQRPPGIELALAQRYYWRAAGAASAASFAPCLLTGATAAERSVRACPAPMRAAPTVTAAGVTVTDGAATSSASIAASRSGPLALDLDWTVSGLTAPRAGVVLLGSGALIEVSAEL